LIILSTRSSSILKPRHYRQTDGRTTTYSERDTIRDLELMLLWKQKRIITKLNTKLKTMKIKIRDKNVSRNGDAYSNNSATPQYSQIIVDELTRHVFNCLFCPYRIGCS